ncbi:MAG: hypothetical protein LBB62_00465 [Proteiniphilum sp.]|jgi:hypothetical protein|nr:hypothetical protein [Proteiniphilum sp.]
MGIFKNLINKVLDAEVPPAVEKLVRKKYAKKQGVDEESLKESLKRNMYDWVVGGNCKNRPPHATMHWVRCRFDDPAVCSYDNGTTWQPRPEGATISHPGEEDGCHCEAHPYLIENKIELKVKASRKRS